ncbi:uncharacterized protein LOC130369492 [Hyla sarda]|uniref:uncharacterized protein LOC130369492 n=1 Tax=Hyla sarda TaxID=327740 RepID=UPI0024C42028|nr:uncharacterized protein LOC130369492 [Hyla sarda]
MSLRSGSQYNAEDQLPGTHQGRESAPSVQQDDVRSRSSRSARSSQISSASALFARARAKAEAARVQLEFAEKEAAIMKERSEKEAAIMKERSEKEAAIIKEKTEQEAKLHILQRQCAAAAAAAEAAAYADIERSGMESIHEGPDVPEKPLSSAERTRAYVQDISSGSSTIPFLNPKSAEFKPKPSELLSARKQTHEAGSTRVIKEESSPQQPKHQSMRDVTKYLIRKEMVNTGFLKFDDCPENYWAWKASFLNAVKDLDLTAAETLDLMVKWLGSESAEHARRMRRIHLFNPSVGLDMAWQRLEERYGSPEAIEGALMKRLESFPKLNSKDNLKLQELGDILWEVQCAKEEGYLRGLAHLDTANGTKPIVEKLPHHLQEKWVSVGAKYKEEHGVPFPPFFVFSRFVQQQAKMRCDPSFSFITSSQLPKAEKPPRSYNRTSVITHKTTVPSEDPGDSSSYKVNTFEGPDRLCPLHKKPHPLNKCKGFKSKPIKERLAFLRQNGICFKCCESTKHIAKDCKIQANCSECGSDRHISALHPNTLHQPLEVTETPKDEGREQKDKSAIPVMSKCTEICGDSTNPRSCSKICLATVYPTGKREKAVKMYVVLDEQSNRSLARSDFFDAFNITSRAVPYTLKTCAGVIETSGRRATDFTIESLDKRIHLSLPTLIECDMIPDDKSEIPTPEVALHHPHLNAISHLIPAVQTDVSILLLLGRDILQVHKVRQQINGPFNAPYAQRLDLGWVIVGEVCLGAAHRPDSVNTSKTSVLTNGRTSLLSPCQNSFVVKETLKPYCGSPSSYDRNISSGLKTDNLGNSVFQKTKDDDKQAMSIDDQTFLHIMDKETFQDKNNNWVAPLPFRKPRCYLPSNREQAMKRLNTLRKTLQRKPEVKKDFTEFIKRMLDNNHAELAPSLDKVREDHRDYLRFLWYKDNDIDKEVTEYRMRVHVFGNSPSPAVAIYCMRKAAQKGAERYGQDAKHFVMRHFYVDDGLASANTPEGAVNILNKAKQMLAESNLRLHKIASNSKQVMEAFTAEDRAKDLKDLCLGTDTLPLQKSLGLSWDLDKDCFVFQVSSAEKPFTRRGILSTVNSLYDPLGFVAPVTIKGKALVRELSSGESEWDALLPQERLHEWVQWTESLQALQCLQISRCYVPLSLSQACKKELYIFSDASVIAIGAVAYLKVSDVGNVCHVGFVMGKSKLSPRPAHTIPRLELCAAVLAVELYELVRDEIDLDLDAVKFFTDSKTVLGYICNTTKRFFLYVSNRVNRIRQTTRPEQWFYVPSEQNPADYATRPTQIACLQNSIWFSGPTFLYQTAVDSPDTNVYPLVEPEADPEIRSEVVSFSTKALDARLQPHRFVRFSDWKRLNRVIAKLIHVTKSFQKKPNDDQPGSWRVFHERVSLEELSLAKRVIISSVQRTCFRQEYDCIEQQKMLPKHSRLTKLSPFIDQYGLLRVGGRLSYATLSDEEKQPVIIPHDHYIATLIIRYYHSQTVHQGRHITEGAIRAAGFWILGGKRLVSAIIHKCVVCRKLRGRFESQKMAELPKDRVNPEPPFTSVGVDVFGPWEVVTRRTRGGSADSKRWAVLFTCLSIRAVHIELIESMSASSFINALRRFFSVRGPAKLIRSDRGTNFVGACKELHICSNDAELLDYLQDKGCTWLFNTPHSSHMGGAWERLIGVARRILDAMLLQSKPTHLTHETLSTFMAEVMAIINSRPLVPISTDPDNPTVLTPAMLMTQKVDSLSAPCGDFSTTELHAKQWKQVQCLADTFWKRWKRDYLFTLQSRKKWAETGPNIKVGNVVLLKDIQESRNNWPMGIVTNTLPSKDGNVRKVEVKVTKQGTVKVYARPVSDVIVLL